MGGWGFWLWYGRGGPTDALVKSQGRACVVRCPMSVCGVARGTDYSQAHHTFHPSIHPYLLTLNAKHQASYFFGYMSIVSYAFFIMLGSIGFYSALAFVRHIYGVIKVRPVRPFVSLSVGDRLMLWSCVADHRTD